MAAAILASPYAESRVHMTIPSYNPRHTTFHPFTQSFQPQALQHATGKSEPTIAAHVTSASDDVFSFPRPGRPLHPPGISNDFSLTKQITRAGKINAMDVYPAERQKLMSNLDSAIETTRAALEEVNSHWNSNTLAKMTTLFGDGAKSDDVRTSIKSRLENALSGLENARANKGKDIFIEDPGLPASVAYASKTRSGYTGRIVFSKTALGLIDDARIQKTLIHETLHIASNLSDHWYVKIDENGNFFRKAPSSSADGSMPPLTSDNALDNADSVAYAAIVLGGNGHSYHDEL